MIIPPAHTLREDSEYQAQTVQIGSPGVLKLLPSLSAKDIGTEADQLVSRFHQRAQAFRRWDSLLAMDDNNISPGLETMVSNDARTMFSLSVFLASSSEPRRTVAIGGQGSVADRKSGKSERALAAWWQKVDDERLLNGQEPFRYDLAYWMCLYGWYAVQYASLEGNGEMLPVAVPLNPCECYPVFADGLERFVRRYDTSVLEAQKIALQFNAKFDPTGSSNSSIKIVDWYWNGGDYVLRAIVAKGPGGWQFLASPYSLDTKRIPILTGRVAGNPKAEAYAESGSVVFENENTYRDSAKLLSSLMTHTKEVAQSPLVAHNLPDFEESHIRAKDIRSGSVVVHTDDPEARIERVPPGPGFSEVSSVLGYIDSMLQRGGFPYIVYGGLGRELSGFAISQLLEAAERRIGPQVRRLAAIDSIVSQHWLESFRDGEFASSTLSGQEEGNPRKFFVEEFESKDIPKKFKALTEIPIRVGNDLMARMAIARQATGGAGPLLDQTTIIGEILQQQDPNLILDGITRDAARLLVQPLKAALELKQEAADLKEKYGSAADEVVALIEGFAKQIIEQARGGQQGAQAKVRIAPNEMPPEASGVSPDVVKAAMGAGPSNVSQNA